MLLHKNHVALVLWLHTGFHLFSIGKGHLITSNYKNCALNVSISIQLQCNTCNIYIALCNESDSCHFVIEASEAVDNGFAFWTGNVSHALCVCVCVEGIGEVREGESQTAEKDEE